MKNSNSNTINQQACAWIAKLHEAELSASEQDELKSWLALSQEHKTELRRMAQRWEELNSLTLLAVPTDAHKPAEQTRGRFFSLPRFQLGIAAVAAAALLAIAIWPQALFKQESTQQLMSYSTDIGEQRLITLPDNSTVLLNTKSQFSVAYTPEFRDIYLIQGEAHFEVESDTGRPFRVFAGKSKVRAVGTAFSVYLKKETVDITVTHGSVEINSIRDNITATATELNTQDNSDSRSIVSAGHAAKFDQLAGTIETKMFPDATYVPAWHHGKLKFSGEPLEQVVDEISRYSPLSIVILDSQIRDLRIGGLFDVGETKKMFEALEGGFGIKVEYINENLVHLTANKTDTSRL